MNGILKKILIALGLAVVAVVSALLAAVVVIINPWSVPAIFKRNYPDWFEAHPAISNLIKL